MSAIQIPCPKCKSLLKLPNRDLLGRKGKCPRCQHSFVLTDPDEVVPLELVAPAEPAVLPGTSAKWIPDSTPAAQVPAPPFMPANPAEPPAASPFDFSSNPPSTSTSPATTDAAAGSIPAGTGSGAGIGTPPVGADATPVSQRYRRRRKPGLAIYLIGGGIAIIIGIVVGVVAVNRQQEQTLAEQQNQPPQRNEAWEQEKEELRDSNAAAEQLSPTDGEAIPLDYIPFTPHVVLHLRPAELWQNQVEYQKFAATLGDLGIWLSDRIRSQTHFEPEEIQELTYAINFGPRMSDPEVAAVVRLRREFTQSDLLARYRGGIRPEFTGVSLYECETEGLCFLQLDRQTFAVASSAVADQLAEAARFPPVAPADIQPLLRESDRSRLCTLIFDVPTIDTHREFVFIEPLQPLIDEFIVWLGNEVEAISWSLHLEPNLYMETLFRQSTDSSLLKVERSVKLQMQRLPERLTEMTRFMTPSTMGRYQLISRFPAMMKAVDVGSSYHVGPGYVRMVTVLPKHAGPALAAASVYSWDQSVVTDFNATRPVTPAATTEIPALIADRLKMKVYTDFRNTPLQEAFEYIGDVIKTPFELDGDGLKQAGFTQVMPQTYNLGDVPALLTIDTILKKYAGERDPLVMIVDENAKKVTITVKSRATDQGLQIYDTSGAK